jgi:hypothetical protein
MKRLGRLKRKRENWGIDYDYLEDLSLAELQWLVDFTAQHYEGPGTERRKRQNDSTTLRNVGREPVSNQLTPATAEDVLEIQEELRAIKRENKTAPRTRKTCNR